MRRIALILAFLSSIPSHADPSAPVPESLFGVKLGAIYQAGEINDVGTFPVAALTGMKPGILGHGSHIYFRPIKENARFPYIEIKKEPTDEYFDTSFRVYARPVLSAEVLNAMTAPEGKDLQLKWEVGLIEWSDKAKDAFTAYVWAVETCKDFALDLNRKPKIFDSPAANTYSCRFLVGNRELKIQNISEIKTLGLGFSEKESEAKEKALERIVRKLRMEKTRPY